MSDNESVESSSSEEISPPWGTIPAEIYLLNNYDPQSPLPPSEQAKILISSYIQSGQRQARYPPPPPPALGPQELIFLKAWRPLSIRHLATDPGQIGNVWLRTFYGPGSDAKHAALISHIDLDNAIDKEERLLDDRLLYGRLEGKWNGLLELLPELLVADWEGDERWLGYRRRIAKDVEAFRNAKKRFEHGAVAVGDVAEGTDELAEAMERLRAFLPEEEVQPRILEVLRSHVQAECVVAYLIVEDEEALEEEEGLLLLSFVDAFGRVVRSNRVCASEAEQMGGFWLEEAWGDIAEWQNGKTGSDYEDDEAWEALLKHEELS
ncbi:hypothetical protein HO173_008706 [Letharia columbiana]|uniref:Uncharacterized protein n=1 Tax=Letharia columbiana TaxID=112416 RepID=A0A8H6FR68_9LECA|nr:uncharacterized protein HO173_008706 [Letharia columbiana]KAF6233162.1 hypothetical protein HO173_008706 [Letharia columbiana]